MRSSHADNRRPPLCKAVGLAGPLRPRPPFPLCAAFPRSEYYGGLRLLPTHPPPFGFALRVAYACATPGDLPCSDCAHFRHAALLGPARVSGDLAIIGRLLLPSGGRKPVGLWSSSSRGCIASPFRAAAWPSRCLRLARSLAVPRPRLAPPWVANPCGGGNRTRFAQSSFTAHSDRSPWCRQRHRQSAGARHGEERAALVLATPSGGRAAPWQVRATGLRNGGATQEPVRPCRTVHLGGLRKVRFL